MPNVPNLPGVPPLSSYIPAPVLDALTEISQIVLGVASRPWDILLDGESAFDFNSVFSVEFKKESVIPDYTVEPGSFLSYDKVQRPFELHVRLLSGGTEDDRQALISQLEAAADDLNLYDVVTPETAYQDCNILRIEYPRTAEDVGMIMITIIFKQIRESQPASFQNTQQPTAAGQVGGGNVQPQDPPTSFSSKFDATEVQ